MNAGQLSDKIRKETLAYSRRSRFPIKRKWRFGVTNNNCFSTHFISRNISPRTINMTIFIEYVVAKFTNEMFDVGMTHRSTNNNERINGISRHPDPTLQIMMFHNADVFPFLQHHAKSSFINLRSAVSHQCL